MKRRPGPLFFAAMSLGLVACVGEVAGFGALVFGMSLGAWLIGRGRARQSLEEAQTLRHAIATGQHRQLEGQLRKVLALAEVGEAVSSERQWLARSQLGGLLVAEWRLEEARAVYGTGGETLPPQLQMLADFGRHELAVLTETPTETRLAEIRRDRDAGLPHVPPAYRELVEHAWAAVEGLCLVRMGRAREATAALERGLASLEYNPARVVYLFHLGQAYEHIGERELAAGKYHEAMHAFPGTRLASEARTRALALGPGQTEAFFRGMLPEAPAAVPSADGLAGRPLPAVEPATSSKPPGDADDVATAGPKPQTSADAPAVDPAVDPATPRRSIGGREPSRS